MNIIVTAFDQQRKPSFSLTVSDAKDAARAVRDALCDKLPFVKVQNEKAVVVVSSRSTVSVGCLTRAIETHADVSFA